MNNQPDKPEQKYPVYKVINGNLVRKLDDCRDPKKRYSLVSGVDGAYYREFTDAEERQRDEEEAQWEAEAPQRALEEKQRKSEADAFRTSLKYEIRLISFVDILGWSEAVKTAPKYPEQTQKLGLALNTIRN